MIDSRLISTDAATWYGTLFGGVPFIGGLIMWIRRTGARKEREEARLRAIESRQAETDKTVGALAEGQRDLRKAMDHQTDVLSARLDKVVETLLTMGTRR